MNKKTFIYFTIFLIVGIALRLWHLDKPEGMWNDEYLTWQIANAKLPFDFFHALKTNCHAPIHYLYLKLWMTIFGDKDVMLRLSSVVAGVLGVVVMFFASLEFKKKDNITFPAAVMLMGSISSFLIYFSQEMRIYALLFFLTSLVLLYAFKIFNNPKKINFILYSIFSLLLILTHTIGFVFVFFSTASLFVFAFTDKKTKCKFLFNFLGVLILALPFVPLIATILFKTGYFSQWWAPFNFSRTLFCITDVYSPVLSDISHVYNKFSDAFYKNGVVNVGFLIFAVVPSVIGLICFIRGLIAPDKKQCYLITTLVCTVLTVLMAAVAGKIVFVTKYMTEVVPVIILITAYGFSVFKSKAFKIALATVFIVINLFFIIVSNASAVRLVREEGQNLPVQALLDMGLKKNDKIFFLYYPKERYLKYVDLENPDNAPYLTPLQATKYNFPRFIKLAATPDDVYKDNGASLREAFTSSKNRILDDTLNSFFQQLKKGDRLFLVDLTSVSFFPMKVINETASNPERYQYAPALYFAMSYIKEFTLNKAKKEFAYGGYYDTGAWRIYVFKKV